MLLDSSLDAASFSFPKARKKTLPRARFLVCFFAAVRSFQRDTQSFSTQKTLVEIVVVPDDETMHIRT
jgi:hypothetical protein